MAKFKRNERISIITNQLISSPSHIFTLSHFCKMFGAAKSTISEDVDIIRTSFEAFGMGEIETVTGASGGIRYLPFKFNDSKEFVVSLCEKLSDQKRVLPGGYLHVNDILNNPQIIDKLGRLLAGRFAKLNPDFVFTVETAGIPLAMAVAKSLDITCVVARRDKHGLAWPYVSISYVSGSRGTLQTMSLAKRLVHEGQRALIIDDFLKAGGTARGMMEMMREFAITVVGIGVMLERVTDGKRRVSDVVSLMNIKSIDEEKGAVVLPAPWVMGE